MRKVAAVPLFIWGVFLIMAAYEDYVHEKFNLVSMIVITSFGFFALVAGYAFIRPKFGVSWHSGRPVVIYTWWVVVLFFVVPVPCMFDNYLGCEIGTYIYMNGFAFTPFFVSWVLAFNLKKTGLELQVKYSRTIFRLLLVAAILMVIFIVIFVLAVLSRLAQL